MEQTNYSGALQQPIDSGFDATSTTTDVIKTVKTLSCSSRFAAIPRVMNHNLPQTTLLYSSLRQGFGKHLKKQMEPE
jgi:hypothetical protein